MTIQQPIRNNKATVIDHPNQGATVFKEDEILLSMFENATPKKDAGNVLDPKVRSLANFDPLQDNTDNSNSQRSNALHPLLVDIDKIHNQKQETTGLAPRPRAASNDNKKRKKKPQSLSGVDFASLLKISPGEKRSSLDGYTKNAASKPVASPFRRKPTGRHRTTQSMTEVSLNKLLATSNPTTPDISPVNLRSTTNPFSRPSVLGDGLVKTPPPPSFAAPPGSSTTTTTVATTPSTSSPGRKTTDINKGTSPLRTIRRRISSRGLVSRTSRSNPVTPDLSPVDTKNTKKPQLGRAQSATSTRNVKGSYSTGSKKAVVGPPFDLQLPLLAKPSPTSFLHQGNAYSATQITSEQDPAPHQIEIPSSSDLISDAKVCAFLDHYRSVDVNFNLSHLVGVRRLALKNFVNLNKPLDGLTSKNKQRQYKDIVQSLLDCGESISVEGYYTTGGAEVLILNCQTRHQIIVAYRGNDEQQVKPVSKSKGRNNSNAASESASLALFDEKQPATVYAPFRESYIQLEYQVCAKLDELTDEDPFVNIVFCGHSYGGALAVLAATRYASQRTMFRVSAHAYGAPKVGTQNFRQAANSLPNLKVFRVELHGDYVIPQMPVDSNQVKWQHVGHTIAIHNSSSNKSSVKVYRFDKNKPSISHSAAKTKMSFRKPIDRSSQAHVKAIQVAAKMAKHWIQDFCGEDVGRGVCGKDNEKRLMV